MGRSSDVWFSSHAWLREATPCQNFKWKDYDVVFLLNSPFCAYGKVVPPPSFACISGDSHLPPRCMSVECVFEVADHPLTTLHDHHTILKCYSSPGASTTEMSLPGSIAAEYRKQLKTEPFRSTASEPQHISCFSGFLHLCDIHWILLIGIKQCHFCQDYPKNDKVALFMKPSPRNLQFFSKSFWVHHCHTPGACEDLALLHEAINDLSQENCDCYVGVQFHKNRWLIYFTKVAGPCRSGHGVISQLMEVKIPELYSYTH